jgi:sigma-B regulation protein RsbU (phosphoserine phosphatase)
MGKGWKWASPASSIGGDFYDFVPISRDELGIVIGDVSGHGVQAALIMTMMKKVLQITAKGNSSSPGKVLTIANAEIFAELDGKTFISAFYGVLNTRTKILKYARAGHNFPILYSPARNKTFHLQSNGMVLGMAKSDQFEAAIEEKQIILLRRDLLFLYTDGLVEGANSTNEEYGVDRVESIMSRKKDDTAQVVVDAITNDFLDFTKDGDPNADDVTLVCMKVE